MQRSSRHCHPSRCRQNLRDGLITSSAPPRAHRAIAGQSLAQDIKRGLAKRLRDDGFASVAEAVGVDTSVRQRPR